MAARQIKARDLFASSIAFRPQFSDLVGKPSPNYHVSAASKGVDHIIPDIARERQPAS